MQWAGNGSRVYWISLPIRPHTTDASETTGTTQTQNSVRLAVGLILHGSWILRLCYEPLAWFMFRCCLPHKAQHFIIFPILHNAAWQSVSAIQKGASGRAGHMLECAVRRPAAAPKRRPRPKAKAKAALEQPAVKKTRKRKDTRHRPEDRHVKRRLARQGKRDKKIAGVLMKSANQLIKACCR